ncbi:hypothetical protein GCM10009792_02180 [Microcella alkalica]|uniref:Ribosomal protein S18 acetylase RimI-like enzyme n=1 Tax=Microcella alkalica TaxID=355930 RepID=A0A839EEA9_9MICO|nr:GNAT family N-acetyltransferase [Microcella alkalica]MBA8847958.1 ribosomal protein S18 acetylase RimI-like enzyme [Microcella alkalica]
MLGSPAGGDAGLSHVFVRRCTEADVSALETREPPGSGYARGAFARQEAGVVEFLVAVAVADGTVVGSAELTNGEPSELKNLGVDEGVRGHGLGTALIRAAELTVDARITSAGVGERSLVVGVGLDNPRAASLYERLGYRRTGVLSSTTYSYVDAEGVTQTVTERDEELIKRW